MKIKYFKLKNWFYVAIGSLLGMNLSCEGVACEYGVPEQTYRVKGEVTNSVGEPINGILVKLAFDSTMTDNQGHYDISTKQFPNYDTMDLEFIDVDSIDNGHYADTIVNVSFRNITPTNGDGNWNYGTATVSQDVEMREIMPDDK